MDESAELSAPPRQSPGMPPRNAQNKNPLVDLIDSEEQFVALMAAIIRKVASAWSRHNFPPPELDYMFRGIEGVFKANRSFLIQLKEIGPNPSSPKDLGDLLMRWVEDLERPYNRYAEVFATGLDEWEAVQTNPKLGPILVELSESIPPPPTTEPPLWTLDALFSLPRKRLKYYKKLYTRLLESTNPGRSDHKLLLDVTETLKVLITKAEDRQSVIVGRGDDSTSPPLNNRILLPSSPTGARIEDNDLTGKVTLKSNMPIFVGPYSYVFKGVLLRDGELVAIKVLRSVTKTLHAMRRKVYRERAVWAALSHENIVPLYGFLDESEEFGPFGALVSPWYPAGDAESYLDRHGASIDKFKRMKLFQGTVDGACYLHGNVPVIVHGDLKPSNILIDPNGTPKICDFGLVRIYLEDSHSGFTTTTTHTGTERYLAPELVISDELPSTASDVFALGCIGLQFLFDQIPYQSRRHNRAGLIYGDIRDGVPPATRPADLNLSDNMFWDIMETTWRRSPLERETAFWVLETLHEVHQSMLAEEEENKRDIEPVQVSKEGIQELA